MHAQIVQLLNVECAVIFRFGNFSYPFKIQKMWIMLARQIKVLFIVSRCIITCPFLPIILTRACISAFPRYQALHSSFTTAGSSKVNIPSVPTLSIKIMWMRGCSLHNVAQQHLEPWQLVTCRCRVRGQGTSSLPRLTSHLTCTIITETLPLQATSTTCHWRLFASWSLWMWNVQKTITRWLPILYYGGWLFWWKSLKLKAAADNDRWPAPPVTTEVIRSSDASTIHAAQGVMGILHGRRWCFILPDIKIEAGQSNPNKIQMSRGWPSPSPPPPPSLPAATLILRPINEPSRISQGPKDA